MAQIPHVFAPGTWPEPAIFLEAGQRHHLANVLRRAAGTDVTYTDGSGRRGKGVFDGDHIIRGHEHLCPGPTPRLTLAVAPPHARERARFLVEKLAELGVSELMWLDVVNGVGKPPRRDKAQAWADAALEQSRGSWRMLVGGSLHPSELDQGCVVVADPSGGRVDVAAVERVTLMIGPEGGFTRSEIPGRSQLLRLGSTVLRTETAAVAGAVVLLAGSGRWASQREHTE